MVSCIVQVGIHCFWLTGNGNKKVSTALTGMERDYWYPLPSQAGNGYAQSQLAKGQSLVLLLDIQHLPVICNVRLAGDRNWRCCRFGCRKVWMEVWMKLVSQGRLLALGEGMVQASRTLEAGHCP